MTARRALALVAAALLSSALTSLVVGTLTSFGVALAVSMAFVIAADLVGAL